jgi:glycosyltransferase involved in cell wall biosynthesis
MKSLLISIIIPAYKAEKYIDNALNSIQAQTHTEWELIVVEDAFNDRTAVIVEEFSQRNSNNSVSYLRHDINKGLAATRNTGIKTARGTYIALLDHDDVWQPQHLKNLVLALSQDNSDIAYTTVSMFNDAEHITGTFGPTEKEMLDFPFSLFWRNFIVPSSVVMRKSVFEEIGFFEENMRSCEDYEYWLRMARSGYRFSHVDGHSCLYRRHESSLSQNLELMLKLELDIVKSNLDWEIISADNKQQRVLNLTDYILRVQAESGLIKAIKLSIQTFLKSKSFRQPTICLKGGIRGRLNAFKRLRLGPPS